MSGSDDEDVVRSDEEEGSGSEDEGPSEAQLAMQRRRQQQQSTSGLDDEAQEMLEANKEERARMEEEINELRNRSEQRKKERLEDEKRQAERRAEEDARRKAEEEERKRKKEDEERAKRDARAAKMAEFEKWKNPPTRNFVITKKDRNEDEEDEEEEGEAEEKKSKEQLEAEKKATLKQRIQPLEISGFDTAKLGDKAKELHTLIYRLESEKYDLERRFKAQQYDMMELAERARSMNKVGKQGSIKRIQLNDDEGDKIQERFAGCPARIVMYSEYERQKDKRDFGNRRTIYVGPVYGYPADRIKPQRIVKWGDEGLPTYEDMEGAEGAQEETEQEA